VICWLLMPGKFTPVKWGYNLKSSLNIVAACAKECAARFAARGGSNAS
jgi:hypothetical protein